MLKPRVIKLHLNEVLVLLLFYITGCFYELRRPYKSGICDTHQRYVDVKLITAPRMRKKNSNNNQSS